MIVHLTHGERMYPALHPRTNVVRPMFFAPETSDRPDAPCMKCGEAGFCRHRTKEQI